MKILAIVFSLTLFAAFTGTCDRSTPPKVASPNIYIKDAPANPGDPISGEWSGNFKVMTFTEPCTLVLKLDGAKVTGAITSDHTGPGTVTNGNWVDGKLTFTAEFAKHESIALTGALKDGKLGGEFTTEGHTGNWEVTRK